MFKFAGYFIVLSFFLPAINGIAQNALTANDPRATAASEMSLQETAKAKSPVATASAVGPRAATPVVQPSEFITWGYTQNQGILNGVRYQALTDITSLFVHFNSSGALLDSVNFTGRSSYLQLGGAAQNSGTRVHLLIANSGFSNAITEAVMNSTTNRNTLINNIKNLIITEKTGANAPGYVHGVSLDLEPFSWSAATAPNVAIFFNDLRTALDTVDPALMITWYVDPTPAPAQFSTMVDCIDSIDYIIYSAYDFGTGVAPRAISDYDSSLSPQNSYMATYGIPPEKMVVATSTYGRQFQTTTLYGAAGTANGSAIGFTDGLYNTTLRPSPYTHNYVTGDETAWYTDGTDTWVHPGLQGLEFHIRQVQSFGNTGSVYAGRKLGGVAFWSLMWVAETTSYEPIDMATVSQTRTYTHMYDILQTALAPRGNQSILIEGFEGTYERWEEPYHSPDTIGDTDNDSSRTWELAPGGPNRPPSTTMAVHVGLEFENATGNQAFFRHEILGQSASVIDTHAVAGLMDSTSLIRAYVHSGPSATPTAYNNTQVALVVMDANRQLERSAFHTLSTAGWQQITFDLTAGVTGFTTAEPGFVNGNGVLNTAGGGARDIGFIGFLVTDNSGANLVRTLWFDEVSYEHRNPGGNNYVINEFREAGTTSQFVEVYGPAGALPSGFQLRTFESTFGTVANAYSITGSIPNDGGGFGYFVIGDTGVANVDYTNGGSGIVLPITNPGAIQLYNSSTGGVYDSAVYMAHGGLKRLFAKETLGVTDEGLPWIGKVGPGTDAALNPGTVGRYPDGSDTDINGEDFSLMQATPGASNGNRVTMPLSSNFNAAPSAFVSAYEGVKIVANPAANGIPVYSGSALRVVDTTGGGNVNLIGDEALGSSGGYAVEGQVYIPTAAANAQAIGIGFCVGQGATFFSSVPADSAYENGYWLIAENRSGVGLNDSRADHAQVFEFVQASNDNLDGNITSVLGSEDFATVQVTPGTWASFRLVINPAGASGQQLLAQINGRDVWRGSIPAGGRTSGAAAFGFRENHAGLPTSDEGTWIDDLAIKNDAPSINIAGIPVPVSVSHFELD